MKKLAALIIAAGLLSCLSAKLSAAEEARTGLAVTSELDIVSKYVWRGVSLSKAEAYQPSVNFSKNDITANAWLNYSVDKPRQSKFNELDLTLSYERDMAGLSVSPGFIFYTFTYSPCYGEAYVKFSRPAAFLKIVTDHYLSMINGGAAGGYYGDAGLGYEKQLADDSVWTNSALLGWGDAKFNTFNYTTPGLPSQLNVLVLDTAITFKPCANSSVRPHLTYYTNLPAGLREGIRAAANSPDNLVIGIAAGYNFR